tara:strand:+ start:862 stop:1320 length:459 start_codon:yes stop_codon:yes gene_type:complete
MEKKTARQVSAPSILLWLSTLIIFGFAVFSLLKALRSSKKLVLDEFIGMDVYTGIANTLVENYDFVRFSDDNCIKNVNKIIFGNNVELQALSGCEMTFDVTHCDDKCLVKEKGHLLFRVTGSGNPMANFAIPGNDDYTIGLSDNDPSAPIPS